MILEIAKHIDINKKNRMIDIDSEIAEVIKFLWLNRIDTLGCCSGHGKDKPSIVVNTKYSKTEIDDIRKLINAIDNRDWIIFKWNGNQIQQF